MKGIKNNVHKNSVSGATLPTIINYIELFDLKIFDTIVVYIGESARLVDLGLIVEKYEQLISILKKSANPNIRLVLCKIAPRGDTDVTFVKAIIERLLVRHSCEIVDQYRAFFDRHGELILRYYGHDQIHLSISVTRRLLGYINEKVEIVYDFNKCTFPRRRNNDQRNHSGRSYRYDTFSQPFAANMIRLNCADPSHETFQCRHSKPIICWLCGMSGHKSYFCRN